ncbi:MAG: hypothetical protein HYZ10_07770 [Ignavibacteriales bacterium]|nr:hypothetical protein [Ignavibacteriales bacterium]
MKIKILTYCLGLLLVGLAIATPGSPIVKEKSSQTQTIVKDGLSEKYYLNIDLPNYKPSGTNNLLLGTAFNCDLYAISLSRDFQIEQTVAHYENLFRTSRRFTTYLKI